MAMLTDVSSAFRSTTGTAYTGRTRLRGINTTGTGTVTFRDGGAGGVTKVVIDTTGTHFILIPADGVLFQTDMHLTLTGVTGVTVFYG